MKKLILALMLLPSMLFAAETYYNFPDATSLPDAGRILMRDGSSNKNITGAKLKDEVRTAVSDTALSSQPVSGANPYKRVAEFKNSSGVITSYITANGTLVLGTPVALAVTSVYPANGATGVNASTTVPSVSFNKEVTATISGLYIVGISATPVSSSYTGDDGGATYTDDKTWTVPATLAPGTTYNIRVNLPYIGQDASDMSMTCGAMTDLGSGLCESTFTTAP